MVLVALAVAQVVLVVLVALVALVVLVADIPGGSTAWCGCAGGAGDDNCQTNQLIPDQPTQPRPTNSTQTTNHKISTQVAALAAAAAGGAELVCVAARVGASVPCCRHVPGSS